MGLLFVIFGVIGLLLGFSIKKYRLANIVIGYKDKKHDRNKFCSLAGNHLFWLGIILITCWLVIICISQVNQLEADFVNDLWVYSFQLAHFIVLTGFYFRLFFRKKANIEANI